MDLWIGAPDWNNRVIEWYHRATDWLKDFEELDTQRRRSYTSQTEWIEQVRASVDQDMHATRHLLGEDEFARYQKNYPQPPFKYGDAIRGATRGGHGGYEFYGGRLDYQKFALLGLELDKLLARRGVGQARDARGDKMLSVAIEFPQEFEDDLRRLKDKWDARNRAMQDTYFHHTHLENSGLGSAIGTDEPWTAVQFANAISHYTAFGKLLPFKEVMESTEHTFARMSDIFDDRDRKMRDLFDVLPSTAADPK